jgi:hypothetical protein
MPLGNATDQIDSLLETGRYVEARSFIASQCSGRTTAQYLALLSVLENPTESAKALGFNNEASLSEKGVRKAFR